ncbi:hypothetical protein MYK68_14075 [Gordonia sp. PP30]|nr:hypothetical protein [Gordonia sp. PP30]UQE73858.1 hypothetical protein MYK68_14075 [Gordonia sp. PP30]
MMCTHQQDLADAARQAVWDSEATRTRREPTREEIAADSVGEYGDPT